MYNLFFLILVNTYKIKNYEEAYRRSLEDPEGFCAEVGAASCCQSSVLGQPGAPDGTLVSNEGTNPIAGQAVAKHRELIFTCGHHVELRAGGLRVQGGGKRKVSNGARVSVASQWHGLGGA